MQMKNILIFQLNWLGDILFSTPSIRAIKKAFPEARITCAVVPRYAELLKGNPNVDAVIELTDRRGVCSFFEKLNFLLNIYRQGFDACFLLKPSGTKAMLARIAGIPYRIGFSGKRDALTHRVDLPEGHIHRADQLTMLCKPAGVRALDGEYEYFISEEAKVKAIELLESTGGVPDHMIIINPGGNWDAKRWPKEKFIQLAEKMLSSYPDIEIVVTGAVKDIALGKEIIKVVNSDRCRTLAGETDIATLAALFIRSTVVISADSGPLHLASASGARTIGLFGPTLETITGPRGSGENIVIRNNSIQCELPCYEVDCSKGYECMDLIAVDQVVKAIEKIVDAEGVQSI
jgi:lipopolysaccharide heptosyltransferase II